MTDLPSVTTIGTPKANGDTQRLEKQVIAFLDNDQLVVFDHTARPWGRGLYTGTSHTFTLRAEGTENITALREKVADIPAHPFSLRKHILGDVALRNFTEVNGDPTVGVAIIDILMMDKD